MESFAFQDAQIAKMETAQLLKNVLATKDLLFHLKGSASITAVGDVEMEIALLQMFASVIKDIRWLMMCASLYVQGI